MFRILLWRICFDYWNVIAHLLARFPDARWGQKYREQVYYFGFGANLSPAVLASRFIEVIEQEDVMIADYELRFNQSGQFEGFGFASVHAAAGKQVFGRIITMCRIDEIRMDYCELLPFGRVHIKKHLTHNGKRCYFYQSRWPEEGLRPTVEYYEKIMQAVERSPIVPADYLSLMRTIQPILDAELRPRSQFKFLHKNVDSKPVYVRPILSFLDKLAVHTFLFFRTRSATAFLLNKSMQPASSLPKVPER